MLTIGQESPIPGARPLPADIGLPLPGEPFTALLDQAVAEAGTDPASDAPGPLATLAVQPAPIAPSSAGAGVQPESLATQGQPWVEPQPDGPALDERRSEGKHAGDAAALTPFILAPFAITEGLFTGAAVLGNSTEVHSRNARPDARPVGARGAHFVRTSMSSYLAEAPVSACPDAGEETASPRAQQLPLQSPSGRARGALGPAFPAGQLPVDPAGDGNQALRPPATPRPVARPALGWPLEGRLAEPPALPPQPEGADGEPRLSLVGMALEPESLLVDPGAAVVPRKADGPADGTGVVASGGALAGAADPQAAGHATRLAAGERLRLLVLDPASDAPGGLDAGSPAGRPRVSLVRPPWMLRLEATLAELDQLSGVIEAAPAAAMADTPELGAAAGAVRPPVTAGPGPDAGSGAQPAEPPGGMLEPAPGLAGLATGTGEGSTPEGRHGSEREGGPAPARPTRHAEADAAGFGESITGSTATLRRPELLGVPGAEHWPRLLHRSVAGTAPGLGDPERAAGIGLADVGASVERAKGSSDRPDAGAPVEVSMGPTTASSATDPGLPAVAAPAQVGARQATVDIAGSAAAHRPPAALGGDAPADQILAAARLRLRRDRGGMVEMHLQPPALGRVRLQVTLRDGALAAYLGTETHAAQQLLVEQAPALRAALQESGLPVEALQVGLDMSFETAASPHRQPEWRPTRAWTPEAAAGPAPQVIPPPRWAQTPAAGLDYLA